MLTYNCRRHLSIVFHLLLLSDLSVFEVAALTLTHPSSGSSTCTTSHRIMKTRYESYRETYIRKIFWIKRVKTRINWRLDHYWIWETTEVCCTGYKPQLGHGDDVSCGPICDSGCYNGHCLAPDFCVCNNGYTNPTPDFSRCVPDCPSGCHGGRCVEPKVCTCNFGYVLATDRGSCKPSCISLGSGGPEGCGQNASCIAPQTCRCDEGYAILTNTTAPQDSSGPVGEASMNSDLTPSPLPTTDASIFEVGNITCKPHCKLGCSANASCVAPNECRCDTGYRSVPLDDGTTNEFRCVPICEKSCVNAVCDHPNRCSCFPGYEPRINDSFECQPVCKDSCVNAICAMPDRCECIGGYEKSLNTKPAGNVCAPICPGGCGGNASCIAPQTCGCDKGYAMLTDTTSTQGSSGPVGVASMNSDLLTPSPLPTTDASDFEVGNITCKPYCEWGCSANASCIAPNVCRCDTGYRSVPSNDGLTNESRCIPICEKSCFNAVCDHPNRCSCFPGYEPRMNDSFECQPVCKDSCINAICAMPDRCECIGGYEKSLNTKPAGNVCAPICPGGCGGNASCIAPQTCRCDEGYAILTNTTVTQGSSGPVGEASMNSDLLTPSPLPTTDASDFEIGNITCKPYCESGCSANASCVAPSVCRCDTGYRSIPLNDGTTNESRCVPICEKSCVNAVCDHPNRCSCFPGYEPRMNDSFECQPVCKDSCVNAICAMPDQCECIGGYVKSPNTKPAGNVCAPICPGGCPNGKCIAPGICDCNEGYVLAVVDAVDVTTASSSFADNDTAVNSTNGPFRERCLPFCSPSCPNGSVCIAPQVCQMQLPLASVQDRCNGNGALSKENDTCLCNHGWTGSRCEEANLCGIFHSLGNGTGNFTTLKRLYYSDNWDWMGPMCKEKCNEWISSLMTSANTSEDAVRCYHLAFFEATVGLVSWEVSLSELPERANETLFCLFTAEAPCNVTQTDMTNVIVGCSTFILIVACALAWYLQRCNIRTIATKHAEGRDSSTLEPLHVKGRKNSIDAVECICTLDTQT